MTSRKTYSRKVYEVLVAARELLETEGWVQGSDYIPPPDWHGDESHRECCGPTPDDCGSGYCATGAVLFALTDGVADSAATINESLAPLLPIQQDVYDLLQQQLPSEWWGDSARNSIQFWNDEDERNKEDVLDAFARAAEVARANTAAIAGGQTDGGGGGLYASVADVVDDMLKWNDDGMRKLAISLNADKCSVVGREFMRAVAEARACLARGDDDSRKYVDAYLHGAPVTDVRRSLAVAAEQLRTRDASMRRDAKIAAAEAASGFVYGRAPDGLADEDDPDDVIELREDPVPYDDTPCSYETLSSDERKFLGEMLDDARALVNAGWTQLNENDVAPDGTDQYCLTGAFDKACRNARATGRVEHIGLDLLYLAAFNRTVEDDEATFPRNNLQTWNDAPDRVGADVTALLLKAWDILDRQQQGVNR